MAIEILSEEIKMDKHLNLFYTYKTNHIEDNVTRSFIITLNNMEPVHLRLFVKEIILSKLNAINNDQYTLDLFKPSDFEFDLQVTNSTDFDEKFDDKNGAIVGITYSGNQNIDFSKNIDLGGARPDALFADKENELCIIFESKLSDSLYQQQIKRHYNAFFDTNKSKLENVFVEISWTEIAIFFEKILKISRNNKETYFIKEFIDYLESLRLISDFIEFKTSDFTNKIYHNLNKFISFMSKELKDDFSFSEYNNSQMLFFDDIPHENLWIDIENNVLTCTIVCGSGKKWRSFQLYNFISNNRSLFNKILFDLNSDIPNDLIISLTANSLFRLSRFRTEFLANIRGEFSFPVKFDDFCDTFIDKTLNAYQQVDKSTINNNFTKEIKENSAHLDSQNLFPKWEDANSFLQYCYCNIIISIPKTKLLKNRVELLNYFKEILPPIKKAMVSLTNSL